MASALVTGSNSGIGLATTVALARAGHTVSATMRNLDKGGELSAIAERENLPIHLSAVDVNDDTSVSAGFARVVAEFGAIDVLINNAGVPGGGAVEETPLEAFRAVMETNFFGALRCIQAVVKSMRERRKGTIVNVTSVAGRMADAHLASYAASKWALEALSECLAQEMGAFDVRVAIVEPGLIATPIFGKARPPAENSAYPHRRRIRAIFKAKFANPTPPSVVGDLIRDIVDGDSRQLRYPAGPDAAPMLKRRAGMTDEEVISRAAESDEAFLDRFEQETGIRLTL